MHIKYILLSFFLVSCASVKYDEGGRTRYSTQEKSRALYYKRLRLKKRKSPEKRIKLSSEQQIIYAQTIQMNCFRDRLESTDCKKLLNKKPKDCMDKLKRNRISSFQKCIDQKLFNK